MPSQNLLNSVVRLNVYFFLVFFLPIESVFCQHHTPIGSNPLDNTFKNALTLFEQQHYEAAQKSFSMYLTHRVLLMLHLLILFRRDGMV